VPVEPGQLNRYTVEVRQNNRTIGAGESPAALPQISAVPVPPDLAHSSPIQTYDQVFGDLPKGNGDPSITIFGKTVTPVHSRRSERTRPSVV
jgi:hypothetical protein